MMNKQRTKMIKAGLLVGAAVWLSVTMTRTTASTEPQAGPGPDETAADTPSNTPPPLEVSPGMEDVIQMARSGVSVDVLTAFIENSGRRYQPTPDEIIYLRDLGVAPETLAALIRSGNASSIDNERVNTFVDSENKGATEGANTTINIETQNNYAAAPQSDNASITMQDLEAVQSDAGAEVELTHFKSALSPYGNWIYVDGVGECWRPTIASVNATWRPYYDGGRWVYTDSGWYWLSDYSWGWAPFHYGRWHLSGSYGWVWVPGYTWSPAWVSWRTTSTYCGWAPLPAYTWGTGFGYAGSGWNLSFGISWGSYNWVPYRYCYGYYPRYYSAPLTARQEIYNNSTVIKPTIIGDNNTIIINGPDATVVANASNVEVRRVRIRDAENPRTQGPRDYIENGGQTLAAYRPRVASPERQVATTSATPTVNETRAPQASALSNERSVPTTRVQRDARNGGPIVQSTSTRTTTAIQPERRTLPAQPSSTASTTIARTESTRSLGSTTSATTRSRTPGQNTTIQRSPAYNTPPTQSTPILRNGRTLPANSTTRVSSPVVAGGVATESRRTSYTGASALNSGVSRQTVRTPAVSTYSTPSLSRPTYRTTSPSSGVNSVTSSRATQAPSLNTRSYTTPSAGSRVTIQPTQRPSVSITPSRATPSVSRPSINSSRPTISPSRPSVSPSRSSVSPASSRGQITSGTRTSSSRSTSTPSRR